MTALMNNKDILKRLKAKSGSHSPSPKEIVSALGFNPIKYDFCFLSNPYATDLVVKKFHENMSEKKLFRLLEEYPASASYVGNILAKNEGIDPELTVASNGAIESIDWVCKGWGLKKLLIPIPTFSSYYEALPGKHVFTNSIWLENGFKASVLISEAIEFGADSILLICPNNPTGEMPPLSEIELLVNNSFGLKLIIDESFYHFLDLFDEYRDFRSKVVSENVVFIKSMSKDYGVAGLRLGYLHTHSQDLLRYAKENSTWRLNNFSILFSEFLADEDFAFQYECARKKFVVEKNKFYSKLLNISGLTVYPSQANFFLIKMERFMGDLVYDLLIDEGVYVRTMEDKVGLNDSYIRVASRKPEENDIFIESIKSKLKKQ